MMQFQEQNNQFTELFWRLKKSRFRSSFKLGKKERQYLLDNSISVIERHARDFITQRLRPAFPKNDGKQTPMKNHPVFIAQHATATCCRKCLAKWHKIDMGKELTEKQLDYIVSVIMHWLRNTDTEKKK